VYTRNLAGNAPPALVASAGATLSRRLPSMYGGIVAGLVSGDGRPAASIFAREPAEPRQLVGGVDGQPESIGGATATGIALMDQQVAYVWRWVPEPGIRLNGLFIQHLNTHRPSVLASYSTRDARIVGPVWAGSRLMWLVRRKHGSRWYRWSPRSHRYEAAKAAGNIASFTVTRSGRLYWQTAPRTSAVGDTCPAGCPVFAGPVPRFHRVASPG
jgi:hypothetical protein